MKKLLTLALIIFSTICFSQTNFTVNIITPTQDSTLVGFQYALLNPDDSTMITGDVISESSFSFKEFKRHFLLSIYSGEFTDTTIEVNVDGRPKEYIIPDIVLSNNSLDEVVIKAFRPMFKKSLKGMEVNVKNTPLENLENAFDILKASPKIISPDDETLQIIGRGTPTIFVDKQEVSSNDELKAMPADMIDKIDIITNPSARYAAEGQGGVIEIYTTGFHLEGTRTTIGINGGVNTQGLPNLGASIGLNMKRKKFSMNLNLNGSINRSRTIYNSQSFYGTSEQNREGGGNSGRLWSFAKIKMKYDINKNHALTLSGRGWGGGNRTNSITDGEFVDNGVINETFRKDNKAEYNWLNFSSGLRYKWKTDTLGSFFTAKLGYRKRLNSGETENNSNYFNNNGDITQSFTRRTNNKDKPDIGSIDIDYVHQFDTTGWELATGLTYNILYNGTNYNQFDLIDDGWQEDVPASNSYDYTEHIGAVYVDVEKEWDKFGLKFGVRGESTFIRGNSKSLNQQFIDTAYFTLFPNLTTMFFFENDMDLTMSYSTDFQRPRFANYDPFVRQSDSLSIEYGNPYLRPEYGHDFAIEWGIWEGLSFEVAYGRYSNPITNLVFIDTATNIQHNTSKNGSLNQELSANISWPTRLGFWSGYHSIWFEYSKTNFTAEFDRTPFFGIGFGVYFYEHFDLKKDYFINTTLQINKNAYGGGTQSEATYRWNIGAGKKFLDGDLSFQLKVNNIIPQKYNSSSVGSNFRTTNFYQGEFTQFNASLTYKFGRLKAISHIQDVDGSGQGGRL